MAHPCSLLRTSGQRGRQRKTGSSEFVARGGLWQSRWDLLPSFFSLWLPWRRSNSFAYRGPYSTTSTWRNNLHFANGTSGCQLMLLSVSIVSFRNYRWLLLEGKQDINYSHWWNKLKISIKNIDDYFFAFIKTTRIKSLTNLFAFLSSKIELSIEFL